MFRPVIRQNSRLALSLCTCCGLRRTALRVSNCPHELMLIRQHTRELRAMSQHDLPEVKPDLMVKAWVFVIAARGPLAIYAGGAGDAVGVSRRDQALWTLNRLFQQEAACGVRIVRYCPSA
jgi:hypothetical protein